MIFLRSGATAPIYLFMKDPVFIKLKDGADFVLGELIVAVTHHPVRKPWRHPRDNPPATEMALLKPVSPSQSGHSFFQQN
jgi:hypothetical protein